jgi:hypothetical protein
MTPAGPDATVPPVTPATAAAPAVTPAERARFRQMQAYEDAIAYRTARLAAPCLRCAATPCDDHATDLALIHSYRHATPPPAPHPAQRIHPTPRVIDGVSKDSGCSYLRAVAIALRTISEP